jgi:hypothetical protein
LIPGLVDGDGLGKSRGNEEEKTEDDRGEKPECPVQYSHFKNEESNECGIAPRKIVVGISSSSVRPILTTTTCGHPSVNIRNRFFG